MLDFSRAKAFFQSLLPVALLASPLVSGGCASADKLTEPVTFGGDPIVVAAALEIMGPRAEALADVKVLETLCVRQEIISSSGARFVSEGPLSVRRRPATRDGSASHHTRSSPRPRPARTPCPYVPLHPKGLASTGSRTCTACALSTRPLSYPSSLLP